MKAMRRRFPYWLLARRSVQLAVLAAFMYELPGLGRVVTGNLASSTWFGQIQLTDPFVALQALLAGQALGAAALIGALVVAVAYAALGGRIYCAWICPINLLTDLAHWLRTRLGVRRHVPVSRHVRYGVLAAAVCASAAGSTLAWEIVNPITLLQRELMFGVSSGSWLLVVLFLFDLLYSRRGWCGHLCPRGGVLCPARTVRTTAGRCIRDGRTECVGEGLPRAAGAGADRLGAGRGGEVGRVHALRRMHGCQPVGRSRDACPDRGPVAHPACLKVQPSSFRLPRIIDQWPGKEQK